MEHSVYHQYSLIYLSYAIVWMCLHFTCKLIRRGDIIMWIINDLRSSQHVSNSIFPFIFIFYTRMIYA